MIKHVLLPLLLALACPVFAQDITLLLEADGVPPGGTASLHLYIENFSSTKVEQWSASVEFTADEIFLVTAGTDQGSLISSEITPGCWTFGGVLEDPLLAGDTRQVMTLTTVLLAGDAGDTITVGFCGAPPAVFGGGTAVVPAVVPALIEILTPEFAFRPESVVARYDGSSAFLGTGATADVSVLIEDLSGGVLTQAYSYGVVHDGEVMSVLEVTMGPAVAALWGGDGPAFYEVSVYDDGWSVGTVYGFIEGTIIFSGTEILDTVTYQLNPELVDGGVHVSETRIQDTVGELPVYATVVVSGQSRPVTHGVGQVEFQPQQYRRGDANIDGALDLADGIFVLQYLFQGTVEPSCLAALDGNGDGMIDLADGIHLIWYVSFGGSPPPAPFAECGFAEAQCMSFGACP